jgi:hypothetical protein
MNYGVKKVFTKLTKLLISVTVTNVYLTYIISPDMFTEIKEGKGGEYWPRRQTCSSDQSREYTLTKILA